MKKTILAALSLILALTAAAADLRTIRVTTRPQMTCANCENKIKKNLRFEKGVKEIRTDRENQIVTIVYDAEKTDENKILKGFEKIKYQASIVREDSPARPASTPQK